MIYVEDDFLVADDDDVEDEDCSDAWILWRNSEKPKVERRDTTPQLYCNKCKKYYNKDNFSLKMQKNPRRYCLLHSTSSDFGRLTVAVSGIKKN